MGEAGATRLLMPRTDVVPDVNGHHRREMVLADDDPQPVVERMLGEGVVRQRRHAVSLGTIGAEAGSSPLRSDSDARGDTDRDRGAGTTPPLLEADCGRDGSAA